MFAASLLTVLAAALPLGARAAFDASGTTYYMRTSDGLDAEVPVSGKISFVSQAGTTIAGYRDAGVNFIPANEGEVLTVRVDRIDLAGSNYLLLYDTPIEQVKSGTSDGKEQSAYLPAGWIKKLTESDAAYTWQSTADNGGVSFGFHSGSAGGQAGFSITIESVALKDMEYVSATASDGLAAPYRGQTDAVLAGLNVRMDGGLNPLALNSLSLDCSALAADGTGTSNLRLYKTSVAPGNLLATAGADGILAASDVTLRSGANNFYVMADIAPDASGSLPAVTVGTLTVGAQSRTPASPTLQPLEVANEIRIAATPAVYTVSAPADFYDDGGREGKIAEKFEGSVTFVPATPGNAVKVDVTKLAIFNTSSTGYNDVLSFYNGREAAEANLITTLLKEARIVKATAPDGSMTVTLRSTTGVPADGWEAVVSEYTPGNMILSSVTAAPSDFTGTVSAMQKGVDMLTFDIVTDNVSNPLALESVSLTTERPAAFKSLVLYAVDNTTETPVRVKVAELAPAAGSIVVTADRTLVEGHNSFVVVADMADNLVNADRVNLALASVKVSGTDHAAQAVKNIEVKNVWQSTDGTTVISVNGSWGVTSTPYEGSATPKYAAGLVDQITTFRPANSGNVIQLDFESFSVYYASYSTGTRATFEIYNGDACTEDALLWKVDSSTKAASGPGRTFRSTAADGSLTIKFNPNATQSYYLGGGWAATAKEFRDHDMSIVSAEASLPSAGELAVGAKGQALLDFTLTAEGTLSVKTLKKINLSVTAPEALAALEIYVSTQPDGSASTLFGRSESVAATTAIAGEYSLREGANYFFVKADVSDDATPETTVSAGLVSAEDVNGAADSFEGCVPEGGRVIKDMLICEPGEHTVTIAGAKMFYDDGGKDGKITSRISASYTFVPAAEGYAVTLDAKEFSMGNGRIYVYSGRKADDSARLGTITGYSATTGPKELVSKAADGSVTVVITGPSGSTLNGFAIEVGLHERVPYTLAALRAASAAPASEVVRGSSNLPLLRVSADIAGDKDASELGALRCSLAGTTSLSDVKALRLYYTGTAEAFSPGQATLLSSVENPGESVTFDAAVPAGDNGTFNFFVTADLSADAAAGNTVKASFLGLSFNGTPAEATETAPAEVALRQGMKGTFTIGTSADADYATFKAATDALATGIEGPVTFEIENGTYAENLILDHITGTSTASPLTFRAKSGSRADVVVTGKYSSAQKNGIIQITGTPYVTVEHLSVQAGSASFDNAVYVASGSYNATLSDLDVTADKVTSGYSGINLVRTYASTSEAGQYNDCLTVSGCHFAGGRIGLYLASNGIVAWTQDHGYRIERNTFESIGNKAIYATDIRDLVVAGNYIIEPSPVKGYYATDFYRIKGAVISGNRIVTGSDNTTVDTNGLYFRTACAATDASPFRVFNNEVVLIGSPSYGARAIQISNDCAGFEIAYNTFRASGTAVYLFATSGNFTASGHKVLNNIFHSDCTADASYPVYFWNTTDAGGYEFRGNVFYSPNGKICKNDAEVLDAAGFDTLTGEGAGNIYEQSQFVNASDSHIVEAGSLRAGTPLAYVTVDREGTSRSVTAPTIGAYEFGGLSTDAPVIAAGYPRVGTPAESSVAVITRWDMPASVYALAVPVTDSEADAAAPSVEQLMAVRGAEVAADTEHSWNFTGLEPSTSYRAWFLAVSALGYHGDAVATDVFTTARHIEPLAVEFPESTVTVPYGQSVTLQPAVAGGDEPYTYVWTSQAAQTLGAADALTVTPEVPAHYAVSVTSADGQTASALVAVEVIGAPMTVATFDDFALESESHFAPQDAGCFYSGTFAFNYGAMPEYDFWYGYVPSNESSTEYTGLDDQFRSAAGGGYLSPAYAVGYPQGLTIRPVGAGEQGAVIPGFYVTNSAYAHTSMTEGDGFAKKFAAGDWFKLQARVTAPDNSRTDVDLFYLADFRDENALEHYIVNQWEYVDLSALGAVKEITFLFDSSDRGTYGVNTPTYLCIDNFGATPDAEEQTLTVGPSGLDLKSIFAIDYDGTRTEYAFTQLTGADRVTAAIRDGILFLDEPETNALAADDDKPAARVLVSMLQKGHTQRVDLNLTKDNTVGIGSVSADSQPVRILATDAGIVIDTQIEGYSVDIYSPAGVLTYSADGLSGTAVISRDNLTAGLHIVRVSSAAGTAAARVILR